MHQKQIEMAAKMYDARRIVISLQGEERFLANVDRFRPIMKQLCSEKGITEMQATIELVKAVDNGMTKLIALAACVEIMEPSLVHNA